MKNKILKIAEKKSSRKYPFDRYWCEVGIDLTLEEVCKVLEKVIKSNKRDAKNTANIHQEKFVNFVINEQLEVLLKKFQGEEE